MPRKKATPKKEIVVDAVDKIMEYQDRLDEWRKLSDREQATLIRNCFLLQNSLKCLSSNCEKTLLSAPGFQYHMKKCGLTPKRIRGRYKTRARDQEQEEESASNSESDSGSDFSEDDTPVRRVPLKQKDLHDNAVEEFMAYKDRLDDWRKLSEYDQNRILRSVYGYKKQSWHCLSSSCSIELGTYNGLQYHMKRCGVAEKDRLTKCRICHEEFIRSEMPEHKKNVHGVTYPSVKTYTPARKSTQKKAPVARNDAIEEQHGMEASDHEDEINISLIKKRRARISFARVVGHDYRNFVTKIYENYINESYGGENSNVPDLFGDAAQALDWPMLDEEQMEPYLPYLMDSVRISVEELQKDDKTITLKRFQSLKTRKGFIAFCGSAITVASWCPVPANDKNLQDQYVLIASNNDSMVRADDDNLCGAVQLWKLNKEKTDFRLQYIIAHDYGAVADIKWCPSSQWKPTESRIGAVAVASSIGEVGIYVLKNLTPANSQNAAPVVYKPQPFLRLHACSASVIYSLDWSMDKQHNEILAGLSDGTIARWRLNKRTDPNMLDDEGRLLPDLSLEVANGPVRTVRWWSGNHVIVASLDRQLACWNLDTGVCLTKYGMLQIASVACLGSYFPAIAYSIDASLAVPTACVIDFLCSTSKLTMPASSNHSAVVWAISINPWSGELLTVDNNGKICRTCAPIVDGIFESKRRKFVEEVVLKSTVKRETNDEIYDYGEASRQWSIKFTYTNKLPTKAQTEKEFKETGLDGQFPLSALFTAAWNTNKDWNNWSCCGGQNGLLHVINFDKK